MKTLQRLAAVLGMALGAAAIWLAFSMQQVFSSSSIFHWGSWQDYAFMAALIILGGAVMVVSYCFGFRWHAEPDGAGNSHHPGQ